jgi:DNA repair protein RadD
MNFTPRPYQVKAIDSAVKYFQSDADYNAFEILPTGSGKSVVIANIAKQLHDHGQTLVFQPSKEILEQNYKKFRGYGFRAEIYSASLNSNHVGHVTFATIGSVIRKKHLFRNVRNVIVDECHLVNADGGMYHDFIRSLPDAKLLGLTATPYRLATTSDGPQLEFINRTRPRIFDECLYYIQNRELFDAGHLAKLEYFSHNLVDRTMIRMNAAGTDFDEKSLQDYYRQIDMPSKTAEAARDVLSTRKNVLVFCASLEDAYRVAEQVPGAEVLTGETEKADREAILSRFTRNDLRCLINVGVLTTGFDYPALESVLMARSTMSLSLYYQIVGRGMRPHPGKESCHLVDLGGNVNLFGKIESMEIRVSASGLYSVWNTDRNKQLTNVPFSKN